MMNVLPFCENWARLVALRDDVGKLRFFSIYLKVAFEGWQVSEADPIEVQTDYWIIYPMLAERLKKSAAGRAGGRPKKTSTEDTSAFQGAFSGAFSPAFSGAFQPSESAFSGAFVPLRNEKKGKEKKESEQVRALTPDESASQSASSSASSDEQPATPPRNAPTLEDVRAAAHKLGIPDDFAEYFQAEMDKLDWKTMKPNGAVYPVTRLNVAQTLRNWWHQNEQQKKERAAREEVANLPPMNGAGRAAIEAFTGEGSEQ
jgi:hypothetical protein